VVKLGRKGEIRRHDEALRAGIQVTAHLRNVTLSESLRSGLIVKNGPVSGIPNCTLKPAEGDSSDSDMLVGPAISAGPPAASYDPQVFENSDPEQNFGTYQMIVLWFCFLCVASHPPEDKDKLMIYELDK
jgi:hypothetical protein